MNFSPIQGLYTAGLYGGSCRMKWTAEMDPVPNIVDGQLLVFVVTHPRQFPGPQLARLS